MRLRIFFLAYHFNVTLVIHDIYVYIKQEKYVKKAWHIKFTLVSKETIFWIIYTPYT